MSDTLAVIVLGASGYVGGEFLRLVHGHPRLELVAAVARRHAGTPVAALFPHLATAYPISSVLFLLRTTSIWPIALMLHWVTPLDAASISLQDVLVRATAEQPTQLQDVKMSAAVRWFAKSTTSVVRRSMTKHVSTSP